MKRPAIYICLSIIIGILLNIYKSVILLLILMITYSLLILFLGRKDYFKYLIIFPLICYFSFIRVSFCVNQINEIDKTIDFKKQINIEGKLLEKKGNKLIIKVSQINQNEFIKKTNFKAIVYTKETIDDKYIGQKIFIKGNLIPITPPSNKGQWNQKNYYYSKKIFYKVSSKSINTIKSHSIIKLNKLLNFVKGTLKSKIDLIYPKKEAGILKAMVIGYKDDLLEDTAYLYETSGITHLLAISGLHIAIIGFSLYKLLSLALKDKENVIVFIVIIFLIFYCQLTGNNTSTVRATVMACIFFISKILYVKYDIFSSLAITASIILLNNPFQLFDSGFILSFFAVLGIIYMYPILEKKYNYKRNIIKSTLFVSFSATIFTIPITAIFFYEIPSYAVVLNMLIVPLINIVLISASCGIIASFISISLGKIIGSIAYIGLNYIEALGNLIIKFPCSTLTIGKPSIIIIIIYYILIILVLNKDKIDKHKNIAKRTSIFFITIIIVLKILNFYVPQITFLDVGQGDSSCIKYQNKIFFIDGGGDINNKTEKNVGSYILEPFLKSNRFNKIDGIFVSHSDFDHIYGIIEIINKVEIKWIVLPNSYKEIQDDLVIKLLKLAKEKNIKIIFFKQGDYYTYKNLIIKCIAPHSGYNNYTNNNERSLVLQVEIFETKILYTGDIEKENEKYLLENNLLQNVDIIKVPHHGSNTSSTDTFLQEICPKVSIFSYGANNPYGHPSKEIVEKYEAINSNSYHTKNSGAITIRILPKGYYFVSQYLDKRLDFYR